MELSKKQLRAVAETAEQFTDDDLVLIEETSLGDRTTVTVTGYKPDSGDDSTILVGRNGLTADLSHLGEGA